MRHKIVFVVPDLQLGGAERQVVDLVNHLDPERFEATLFTFQPPADLADAVRADQVQLVHVPRQFKLDARPIARLARLIRDEGVALVHCTLQMSLLVAHAARLCAGRTVPIVDALHTTRNRSWREEVADRVLYVPLMRACRSVITVCEAQRRFWASKYPSLGPRMITVYNGIDLDRYRDDVPAEEKRALRRQLGIDDRDLVLGMVAVVRPEKNHEGVLEAASRLVRMRVRVKFLFVGGALSEAKHAHLQHRARQRGLCDHVRWLGWMSDPRKVLSVLDAVLLFSTTESFPLSLLEGLAMGKPAVSSDVGGVPEIVEHGRNGLLVRAGDVGALVSALARVAADRPYLRALSAQARSSIANRFSVPRMVRDTEEVLLQALRWPDSRSAAAVASAADAGGLRPPSAVASGADRPAVAGDDLAVSDD